VGAHIGLYTMPMSRAVGPGGAVYAFEPARGNLRHLRRHLKYNSLRNVEILPFVVGEESRDGVRFFEAATADGMGGVLVYKHAERYRESTLPQISLDDFCLERGVKPELIKIDVEGAEIRVLHGARRLLAECSPDIVLSVHPNHLRLLGESVDALRELISSAGYRLLDLDGSEPEELVLDEYLLLPSRPA
jgi:FkbM family methyltransferase